jgi:uncharacterized membrane protein YgcG
MKRQISVFVILSWIAVSIGFAQPASALITAPVIEADVAISATHVTVGLQAPATVDDTEDFFFYQLNRGDGVWRNIAGAFASDVAAIQIPASLFPVATNTYVIRIRGTAVRVEDGILLEGPQSNAVSVRLRADAPTDVRVLPAPANSLAVTFTAPVALEAAGVIGFEYSLDAGVTWQDSGADASATEFAIADLAAGDVADVQVRAVNAGFAGASSSTVTARVGIPEALVGVVATPRVVAGEVDVAWQTPDSFAQSAIERLQYAVGDGDWQGDLAADATSVVITGLADGLLTTVKVRAVNGAGDGVAGVSAAVVVGSPRAPVIAAIDPGNTQLIVTLATPSTQVSTATFTRYQFSVDDGATWRSFAPDATSIAADGLTGTGLVNNQTYQLVVRGVNSNGAGPASDSVTGTPAIPVPGAATVTSVTAVAGNSTTLRVAFTAPGNALASGVTTYQYSIDAGPWRDRSAGTTNSPMEINGLSAGVTVGVRVRAVNLTAGLFGAASNSVSGTTTPASTGGGGSGGSGGGGSGGGGAGGGSGGGTGGAPEAPPPLVQPQPDAPLPVEPNVQQSSDAVDVEIIRSMTPVQVKALSPEQLSTMNVAAFAALRPEQVRALDPGQLRALSADQIAAIPVASVRVMRPRTLRSLTVRQVRGLSPMQARALSPTQVRALGPTKRRVVEERRASGLEFRLLI